MEAPFIGALSGTQYVQQFAVHVPFYHVSPKSPDNTVDWSRYYPISGAGSVYYKNKTGYAMQHNLTIERQIGTNSRFSLGYIGSLGRHFLTVHSANPGDPALCLSLSQPSNTAPGSPTCGPFNENLVLRASVELLQMERAIRSTTRSARMPITKTWATRITTAWN